MLESLRKAAGTWVAKLLLLILVVSFAVWGISGNLVNGIGSNAVITAGNTSVSATDFRLAYNRQLNLLSQQFGQQITREQAQAMGIEDQVLAQLVSGALLDEQAREMGLGLSKDRLANLTAEDPAFQGPDGRFDRERFVYLLQQIGMRPEDYFNNRANVAIRQQIIDASTDGLKAPDTFLRAVALYRGEDRTVEYLNVPRSIVEPIEEPSNEVLAKWFDTVKARYAAPEYRKIAYVKLEPEDISDPAAVTDDQVREDYEKNKARHTTPETRAIEQLVFASADKAKAAKDAIAGGKTFEQAMADEGKTAADVQLGTLAKDKVPDAAIAEAAFKLQSGQVSDPIQGAFGTVLVRVTAINPEVVKPQAEVADQIRKDIALGEANRILLDVHDSYEDARAGGASLKEAAEKMKLKLVTIEAVDVTGKRPDDTIINDLPASANLLRAAFEAEQNTENQPLNIGSNGFVFYEVEGITPARERTLDEVKAKAIADWKTEQADSRLADKLKEFQKRVTDGATLDVVAGELKLEKLTKRGLKREGNDPDFGQEGVSAIFDLANGGVGVAPASDGTGRLLFKVTEVIEPMAADATAIPEDARKNFAEGLAGDMLDELVARLRGEFDVEVNRAAAQQALTLQ
ncbi:MAG: SurA N-terminal domain-containing protein [Rhizobiaceae bacterium]